MDLSKFIGAGEVRKPVSVSFLVLMHPSVTHREVRTIASEI